MDEIIGTRELDDKETMEFKNWMARRSLKQIDPEKLPRTRYYADMFKSSGERSRSEACTRCNRQYQDTNSFVPSLEYLMSSENAKVNYKHKLTNKYPPSNIRFYENEEEKFKFLINVE